MKEMKLHLSIALLIAAIINPPVQAADVCKVTDPTGTPLNVRATPNGRIVGIVRNEAEVYIEEIANDDKGRPWAQISTKSNGKKRVLGWVIREFISCYKR